MVLTAGSPVEPELPSSPEPISWLMALCVWADMAARGPLALEEGAAVVDVEPALLVLGTAAVLLPPPAAPSSAPAPPREDAAEAGIALGGGEGKAGAGGLGNGEPGHPQADSTAEPVTNELKLSREFKKLWGGWERSTTRRSNFAACGPARVVAG